MSPSDSENTKKKTWELTKEALSKLLANFSADPEEAAAKHEAMRRKLARVFEWKSFPNSDELVDEVINRVARRIDEGEKISNLNGYFRTVAKNVEQEERRKIRRNLALDDVPEPVAPDPEPDEDKERRLKCLDECLDDLQIRSRTLILQYYYFDDKNKIDHRRQLAESLNIPLNALRIRACRVRGVLENCVQQCLDSSPGPK